MDWIHVIQDRNQPRVLVNKVMNLRVPWKARNFLTSGVITGFSRRILLHGIVSYGDTRS